MSENEIYVPPIRPNEVLPPPRILYSIMGEANIRQLLADFYAELEKSEIREMFPKDMFRASQKNADFFIGLLGGPALYHQKYGNPMMRARHMPFTITESARDVWLACFEKAVEDAVASQRFPPEYVEPFVEFLAGFSMWMVNTEERKE